VAARVPAVVTTAASAATAPYLACLVRRARRRISGANPSGSRVPKVSRSTLPGRELAQQPDQLVAQVHGGHLTGAGRLRTQQARGAAPPEPAAPVVGGQVDQDPPQVTLGVVVLDLAPVPDQPLKRPLQQFFAIHPAAGQRDGRA
jgi:hypothetical protein